MSIVRFIHISDLHIAKRSNTYGLNDILKIFTKTNNMDKLGIHTSHDILKLNSLNEIIIKNEEHIDFLLITGDIATSSSTLDLELSSNLISNNINKDIYSDIGSVSALEVDMTKLSSDECNLLSKVNKSINKSTIITHKNIIMLPGNHDRIYTDESFFLTSCFYTNNKFSNYFNSFWNPKFSTTKRIHSQFINIKNSDKKLLFIKVDCNHDKAIIPLPDIGTREFSLTIESDLRTILTKGLKKDISKSKNYIPIISLHYLPTRNVHWSLSLRRWDNLIKLLNEFGIKYLFCGHTHLEKAYQEKGVNIFCSSSTLSTKDKNSRVNVFKYDADLDEMKIDKHYYWEKKFFKFELAPQ